MRKGLVEDALQTLLLEVIKQVEATLDQLDRPHPETREACIQRDDYIDSLKIYLENRCFSMIFSQPPLQEKSEINHLRAVNTIGSNLERIADHCVNILRQIPYLDDVGFLKSYDYQTYFKVIHRALEAIPKALFSQHQDKALMICRSEERLDEEYKKSFTRILAELAATDKVENLITTSFILRYLERIGDCLLNIGEAILFSIIGDKLRYNQFEFLQESLAEVQGGKVQNLAIEGFWGTRSGCRIGLARTGSGSEAKELVYKEGQKKKIQAEKEKIELWQSVKPNLTPKILDYLTKDDSATLMVEFITGKTIQANLYGADPEELQTSIGLLQATLTEIWSKTQRPNPNSANFIGQLLQRIDDVFRMHPNFQQGEIRIGDLGLLPLVNKLESLLELESRFPAPFTVLVHGDFNVDNIILDQQNKEIRFIDVHRTAEGDFVQDIAVFLVSNFRQKSFDDLTRSKIAWVVAEMLQFARNYAEQQQDKDFELRLALGVIRSLISSTRFEFHTRLAHAMFGRANYLIDRLRLWQEGRIKTFVVPLEAFHM